MKALQSNVLLRFDVSQRTGAGHFVRARHLSTLLQQHDCCVQWVVQSPHTEQLKKAAAALGITRLWRPQDILKHNWGQRAQNIAVVNDVRHSSRHWMQALHRGPFTPIINLEDSGEGRSLAHQRVDVFKRPYASYAYGWKYALLHPAFAVSKSHTVRASLQRIIICMGGTDILQLSAPLARFVLQLADKGLLDPASKVQVALSSLASQVAQHFPADERLTVHRGHPDMKSFWQQADVAIVAAGTGMLECAALGVPMMLVAQVLHQKNNVRRMCQAVDLPFLGLAPRLDWELLSAKLVAWNQVAAERQMLSQDLQKTIDGRGMQRLIHIILSGMRHRLS